ncbi:MAG: hypothetical protein J6C13_03360, partial [Clostridia bacterium]|nr:hypothetical protein [Clostridia bacterium]
QPTTFGDFASTITWKYAEELETSQFKVSLTNKATGEVAYITDTAGLDFVREYDNSVSRAVYTINLKGLNLNTNTVIGADPTRNLPAGEYLLGVQVLGDGAYKTDSAINYDATTYVNKFGVRAVTTQDSFAVAPECFFNESEVINNDIVITDSTRASYLSEYETKYGFNNKYLVITQAGFEATKATQFKILVNGKDAGVIDNTATTLDFNGIVSSNKLKLKDTDWQIGANTITLMPWGNENYFFYVDTTQSVPTPVTLSESVAKLQTEFDTNLYYRYNAPATPVTVDLTFSDKPVNHNITGVNIMFGQADASAKYAVTVHYLDHYDNNAQKVYGTFNDLNVDFDNNKSLGIAMYDLISTMGPHTIWFEVQRTAGGEANEQYYLDSFKANTQANKFVFTTVVQQFSSLEIAGQTTSIVQAINSTTEDTSICAQHSNGFLSWTLPTHPYSVQIKYSVSMLDKDRNFEKVYTDTLSLTINEDSDTIDYVWLENTGLFTIYNNLVYFDMREYFLDTTRVGASAGMYYLAGNYFFLISAQALDKVGTAVPTKIFSPDTFGANNNYMMFTYENIRYPFEPSNVVVDANGVLTWNYEGDTLYPTDPQRFKIIIETYKEDGTKYEEDIILDGDVTKQADISSYLVAGGKERNNVYVYRVAPNDTYRDSVSVKATFADDYPNTLSMPDFIVDWSDAREVYLRLPSGIPAKTYREVTDNGKTINFNLSIMRITSGKDLVQPTDTFDSILANTSGITFVTQNLGSIEYDTSTEYKMNIYDRLQNLDATNWLDGEALIAGLFILKVELSTDHIYYTSNIKNIQRGVKDIWKVYDTPTLTGEYLTLKNKNQEAQPVNSNDRNWANAAQKDAILTFVVGTIADDNGTLYLPENVTVTMKLYNGIDYDLDRIYSITYALPTLNDLGTNAEAVLGDVTISRYFDNGAERHEYKYVTINLHKFFDLTSSEVYAGPYAGVYHMIWKVDGDSIGDSSVTQTFEKEICHYTVIPTPILDYRLGYTSTGSLYTYVLNWGFIPNQYTYMINDSADYNLNIFAFEKRANGTYACDEEYNSLTDEQKIFFLQDRANLSFEIEKNLLDFATIYTIDGRRCYVNYATNSGLELIPNKEYKFFMYLSKKSSSTDPNAIYYLDSETSKGQEYLYKQVSTNHINSIAGESASGIVPVENETNYNDGMYYTFSSKQDSNNYNNAFELFVYDTQDPRAGTDNTWMIDQEINGTYLAHYIISTKDNANANSKTQDLFIVEGYQDRVIGSGTYGKKVGILSGSQITLDLFTLQDLLADKTLKPITYYCKIKTWIDNNLVNANAPLDDNGDLEDAVIYGEKWIKQNITTDPQLVQNYVDTLASKVISVPFLDLNSYNPSTYFSFQHKIKFATPNISKIEIVNETGYDDVSGVCEVTYSNSSTGVTTGF